MVERRPSIYASAGYVDDLSPQNIQKAMHTLRLRTQEALSQAREEIARLEEEKEIAEMRIQELKQELAEQESEQEFGKVGQLKGISPHQEEKKDIRRWSLGLSLGGGNGSAGGGASNNSNSSNSSSNNDNANNDNSINNSQNQRKQSNESLSNNSGSGNSVTETMEEVFRRRFSNDGVNGGGATTPDPGSRRGMMAAMRAHSNRSLRNLVLKPTTAMERDQKLMEKLHQVQEGNKREIEKHQSTLDFKGQQVQALQLTAQSQEHIMEKLEVDIAQLQLNMLLPDPNDPPLDEVKKLIQRRSKALQEIQTRTNDLQSTVRNLKRIQAIDGGELEKGMIELRQKVVASNLRLKSTQMELEHNQEILIRDLEQTHGEWKSVHVRVNLMESVSQKQLRRIQKLVSRGRHGEITNLIQKTTRATEEELMMRRPDARGSALWTQECATIETANKLLMNVCRSLTESTTPVLTKELSESVIQALLSMLQNAKGSLESARDNTDTFLGLLDKKLKTYQADETFLHQAIRTEMREDEKKQPESPMCKRRNQSKGDDDDDEGEGDDDDGEEEGDGGDDDDYDEDEEETQRSGNDESTNVTEITETTDITSNKSEMVKGSSGIGANIQLEALMRREAELDERIKGERQKLEEVRERAKNEKAAWKGKVQELKQMFKQGKLDWSKKDRVLNRAIAEVEELKTREDELRNVVRRARKSARS